MRALAYHVGLAVWRARHAVWGWRHYRVCGNCRYYGDDPDWRHAHCCQRGWYGKLVQIGSEQPGCERWRRLHEEPERP